MVMVKKDLTVSVANRTLGGKTETTFKLEGNIPDKLVNAVGEEAGQVLQEAIASFGRKGPNRMGKDSKAFGAYLQNLGQEMLRAVGEGRDATSRFQRSAVQQILEGMQAGYRISREASSAKNKTHDKAFENRLIAAKSKADELEALISRTKDPERAATLKKSLAETKELLRKYEEKQRANFAREARIRLTRDPETEFGKEVDITLYERRVQAGGGVKTRNAIRREAVGGFKLSDIQGKHSSVDADEVRKLKDILGNRGERSIKFTKAEEAEWANGKLPSLPATTLVQKMGGFFDLDNPKTDDQKRLAKDRVYRDAYSMALLEIANFGEGDSRQAEQGLRAKLGRDMKFVLKQIKDAEKSNKKQGLGKGSRGGRVQPTTPDSAAASGDKKDSDSNNTTPPPPPPPPPPASEPTASEPTVASEATKTTKRNTKRSTKPASPKKPKMDTKVVKNKPLIGEGGIFASEKDFEGYKKDAGFDEVSKKQIARFFAESTKPIKEATTASKYVIPMPDSDMAKEEAEQIVKLRQKIVNYNRTKGKTKEALGNMLKKAGFEDPDQLVLIENTKDYKANQAAKKENAAAAFEKQSFAPAQLITPFVNKYFPQVSKKGTELANKISKLKATDTEGINKLAKENTWTGANAIIEFAKKLNEYAKSKRDTN